MNLLPRPRILRRGRGVFALPVQPILQIDPAFPQAEVRALAARLPQFTSGRDRKSSSSYASAIKIVCTDSAPSHTEGYSLSIRSSGIVIQSRDVAGARAAVATLRQLFRESGRRLPCLYIRDWPDFPRRGVLLDISRGRVPKRATLLELVDQLADFKINELQLYMEHTFAYRKYKAVWGRWGALTARDIRQLDARCRDLGIDLVPNQNSFGHMRHWLEHPPLRKLAEVSEPYEGAGGEFVRYPSTLAPNHPDTLPFLRKLYDELLPNFSSPCFNVGCDETWDLGRGQSRALCAKRGKGRVYLDFLKSIHREVSRRGKRMMFWGDIVLNHPELIRALPRDVVALNWGYEADHPFARETRRFAAARVPFYVCPGTSTWMSLIGRHDHALENLRSAADAGRRRGAIGYLMADWGDGGHPQPLAVSYLPWLAGAALSWCARSFDEKLLVPVLSRDIFDDQTRSVARAASALGLAHRRLRHIERNSTPLGTVIAAPRPETRELFCYTGRTAFRRISRKNILAVLAILKQQLATLHRAHSGTGSGMILIRELELATRMAAESCHLMLWQKSVAAGDSRGARMLARSGIRALTKLDRDFGRLWPLRNKGSAKNSAAFLKWRIADYRRGTL